ncbi:MAG: zinc ribbon domain-containing protein [Candidatus Caldatribacteriota bacterium]|nr:zinc ribbon domain-containing protein [Candidatus Caldatribacteriota bacterium]
MAAEKRGETRSYQKSFSEVFLAITKALEDLKIGIVSKNEKEGIINISTGFTVFSAGGEGVIEVKSVPDTNETTVAIAIKPKMKAVLIDWGQASRETKQIFSKIEEHLGIVVTEPVPEKVESSTSNTCPSCGKPVGATDKFCQNCGAKLK